MTLARIDDMPAGNVTLAHMDDVTVGAAMARIGDIDLSGEGMPKMGATPLGQNLRVEVPRGGKHEDKGGMIDIMA